MKTVLDLLQQSFLKYKNEIAVKHGDQTRTYEELSLKARQVAACLNQEVPAKSKIGIVGQRNLAIYDGIVGAVLSGSVYVPINPKFPLNKKKSILQQAEIRVLIASAADVEEVNAMKSQSPVDLVIYPDSGSVEFQGENKKLSDYSKSLPAIEAQDLIYVMFTSGSTGQPKGVMVQHGNVIALMNNLLPFYPDLSPGFKSSQTFDLSFDPSVCDMFFTWLKGGTLCVMNAAEIFMPADYIRREKIEFWHSVPMIAEYLGKLGHLKPEAFPSLKYTIFTGEPCKKSVADAWRISAVKSTIENRYGPTELTVDCLRYLYLTTDSGDNFKNGLLPIGTAYASLESQIIRENNELCSENEKGELIVSGPQVTLGYLNDIDKTQKSFVHMPWDSKNRKWYKTGDSAICNELGVTECLGRIDHQIKLAGKRIEIGEIEYSLLSSKMMKEVVVVPYKGNDGLIQGVVAFCDCELSQEDMGKVKKSVQDQLDLSFFPKRFYMMKDVPLLTNGKIDRKQLQFLAQERMEG